MIPKRITHTFVYDNNDRMTEARYADGSVHSYTYDAEGNRTRSSIADSDGTRTWNYTYDSRNRLSTETKPDGSTLAYQYDHAGNKSQLTVTLSTGEVQTITYSYDALNRLETVTNSQGTTTYGYDAVGNRTSLSHANGSSQTWTYDTRNRLTSTSIYNSSGALIQSFDYTLHPTGRRTAITELDGRQSDYTYNDRYWLQTETITDSVNGNYSASYQYDKVGNRTFGTEAGISTAYTYDANDRLTQQGGVTYTYDANGNTLEEDDEGTVTSYGWNSLNQLQNHTQGGFTTQYQYNADGIRHSQSDSLASTAYLVDANRDYAQVLAEITNNALDVRYHYGDDLISQSRAAETHTFHTDGLGSTRVLTDVAGNESDSYGYAAFGEVLSQEGVTDTSYLYTGEQYDAGLDQYYLRARYYDQGVGRFSRMDDWMGNADSPVSLNKYLYANSSPVNYTDPSGYISVGFGGISAGLQGFGQLAARSVGASSARALFSKTFVAAALRGGTYAIQKELRNCIKTRGKKCRILVPIVVVGNDFPHQREHIWDAQLGRGENFGSRMISGVLRHQEKTKQKVWPTGRSPRGMPNSCSKSDEVAAKSNSKMDIQINGCL